MMYGSRITLLISSFLFITGVSAGIFLELAMDDNDKMIAAQFMSQYLYNGIDGIMDYPNPFMSGLALNLGLLLIMMISGFVSFGFPVSYAVLIYKGLALGFSAGLILEHFALDGIRSILISLVPQNLVLIPAFLTAASTSHAYAVSHAASRVRAHDKNGRKPYGCDRYVISYIVFACAVAAACLIETLIFPLRV